MRTVGIAELKNKLSTYLTFAKAGETVIIRDRNRPVAKLVPFVAENLSDHELELVAKGYLRLPTNPQGLNRLRTMPRPMVEGNAVTQALLDERDEGR